MANTSEDTEDSGEAAARARKAVLVVDDNVDSAELLSEIVAALGYETRVAYDGPSALRVVEGFTPDVALLDIGLPFMDGYELADRLVQMPALKGVHLVALTGYGQDVDRSRSLQAGFELHMVKPIDTAALEVALRHLSQRRREPS